MSKNKKSRQENASSETGTTATSAPKTRRASKPRGPLAVRLAEKADKVYSMVAATAKELASRGAPQETRGTTMAFLAQVETWRDSIFALKSSGWEPAAKSGKVAIVEGDPIKIVDEHVARYAFIEGLVEGRTLLVAGAVVQVSKLQTDIMLKDTEGKFYGYAPKRFLELR
jgi:hypothetical protein